MEREIDLRKYLLFLARNWFLFLGLALLGILIATLINLNTPKSYQYVTIIDSTSESILLTSTSESVVQEVVTKLGPDLPADLASSAKLQTILKADLPKRGLTTPASRLFQLTVTYGREDVAQKIGQTWVSVVAKRAADQFDERIKDFTAAVAQSDAELKQRAQELADFQRTDQSVVLKTQIEAKQTVLTDTLTTIENLNQVKRDADSLQTELQPLNASDSVPATFQVALLTLSQRSFGVNDKVAQLQISVNTDQKETVAQSRTQLQAISTRVTNRNQQLNSQATQIASDILALQNKLDTAEANLLTFTRRREVAEANQSEAARQLTINANKKLDNKILVVNAVSNQVGASLLLQAAIGAIAGLLVAFALALLLHFFRGRRKALAANSTNVTAQPPVTNGHLAEKESVLIKPDSE